jgi:hypothetical protein
MQERFKFFVFVTVCILAVIGGIFAYPVLSPVLMNGKSPTVIFWLVFGGGLAVVGFTVLLAAQFGFFPSKMKEETPELSKKIAVLMDGEEIQREALVARACAGDPNVM